MKVVILGNQARALSNFWTVLIKALLAKGHEVVCLVPFPLQGEGQPWEGYLSDLGASVCHYRLDRKGLNPTRDFATFIDLYRFFKNEQPDILFASTIKPVIYGAFAAAINGLFGRSPLKRNRHLMITGLGYMFEGDSFTKRLLMQLARLLYRMAFMCAGTAYFQNQDDRKLFEDLSIIPRGMAVVMTKGTGVDLQRFTEKPLSLDRVRFLYVGRLIEAKGVGEYCKAAALVKERFPEAVFEILGPEEHGPGAYPLYKVHMYAEKGVLAYLGSTTDVRPYLEQASVVVLPSYREGTPCSLMEAMSVGRALIATDAPGCREVVIDGENGFLIPVKNVKELAEAMMRCVSTPDLLAQMGKKSRNIAEKELSATLVAEQIMQSMNA